MMMMEPGRVSPGLERAQAIDALATAIDHAQQIAWSLCLGGPHSREALDLFSRLDAARAELARLRGGGWRAERNEIGSKPIRLPPAVSSGAD